MIGDNEVFRNLRSVLRGQVRLSVHKARIAINQLSLFELL